jgi:hypothetical protein
VLSLPQDYFSKIHKLLEKVYTRTGNGFVQLQQESMFSVALLSWPEHIGKATESLRGYVDSASDGQNCRWRVYEAMRAPDAEIRGLWRRFAGKVESFVGGRKSGQTWRGRSVVLN